MALGSSTKDRPVNVYQQFTVAEKSPFDLDKLADRFRYRDTGWTIPEAFLGILILAGMADGTLDKIEVEAIRQIAMRSRAISSLPPEEQARTNNAVNEKIANMSAEQVLKEACSTLPADMCLPVFAHCVDIILSDGQLLDTEGQFLHKLAEMLDIDPNSGRRVMEVLLLKAQY